MRPQTSLQYQLLPMTGAPIRLNQPSIMPTAIGSTAAHRKGLLRAQAEQSNSQPVAGKAHSAYSGMVPTRLATTRNGCAWVSRCQAPTPWKDTVVTYISSIAMPVTTPQTTAITGASRVPATTLENTVAESDSGSDFQNSRLRSRRSSYSAPRQ